MKVYLNHFQHLVHPLFRLAAFIFLSIALFIILSTLIFETPDSFSKPVAIIVIRISSPKSSSITAPKIIFASGSTLLCTNSAAAFTSCSPK